MAKSKPSQRLMVRLDAESKDVLTRAAQLRQIRVADYMLQVSIAQAREEVADASEQANAMTSDEQLAFWTALSTPIALTPSQKGLGEVMRGES